MLEKMISEWQNYVNNNLNLNPRCYWVREIFRIALSYQSSYFFYSPEFNKKLFSLPLPLVVFILSRRKMTNVRVSNENFFYCEMDFRSYGKNTQI